MIRFTKLSQAALAACLLFVVGAPAARAVTINMEGLPSGSCNGIGSTATTQGYNFAASGGNNLFSCNGSVLSQDTTRSLIAANGQSVVTMSAANNSAFNLLSFDSGTRTADFNPTQPSFGQGSTAVEVVGNLAGGGTVTDTFTFNGLLFQTFVLPNTFMDLTSVVFTGLGTAPNPEMVLDNIVVTAATPLPAALPLFATGLGGLGLLGWRRKRKAQAVD
jgi:hypothetical protein